MNCPTCQTANPEVARFCLRCGTDLRAGPGARNQRYALKPDEPVASLSLVSTIMPYTTRTAPHTYRTALLIGLIFPVISAALGWLPSAILTAAFLVPVVYILYLYDVNMWEDQPVKVVGMAFAFTGLLAVVFTILWRWVIFDGVFAAPLKALSGRPGIAEILIVAFLVPIIAEVLKQIGPLYLASRPAFDDLIDGLTFGVVSGVAFAAFETLIVHRAIMTTLASDTSSAALWVSIVVTAAIIKPVVYGTATGIAVAEYSGLGKGYDGLTPRYYRGLAEAVVANILFHLGLYLTSLVGGTAGAIFGLVWGAIVAAALILRVRTVMQRGLLEAAVEAAARGAAPSPATELQFCPECEMPVTPGADFCISCGASMRPGAKVAARVSGQTAATAAPPPPTSTGMPGQGQGQGQSQGGVR